MDPPRPLPHGVDGVNQLFPRFGSILSHSSLSDRAVNVPCQHSFLTPLCTGTAARHLAYLQASPSEHPPGSSIVPERGRGKKKKGRYHRRRGAYDLRVNGIIVPESDGVHT